VTPGDAEKGAPESGVTDPVLRYHDGTKHHFHRFAQSIGYLDWASQPHPFRSFTGSPAFSLYPADPTTSAVSSGPSLPLARVSYDQLFQPGSVGPSPVTPAVIGDLLRHALGLSAWKRFRDSRWSLRVNPSSGNLHPTEAYIVTGVVEGLTDTPAVWHYAADRHALERRCAFDSDAWQAACGDRSPMWLVALSSIHWREAWKYGERAFRYCQHDLGHAVAAVRLAAALAGWRAAMLPDWSQREIASLIGVDRAEDYEEAEREEPACVLALAGGELPHASAERRIALVEAVQRGRWAGRASQLSEDHVDWSLIDQIARATEDPGRSLEVAQDVAQDFSPARDSGSEDLRYDPAHNSGSKGLRDDAAHIDARAVILQRRSALAFDGRSAIDLPRFMAMLSRVMPGRHAPWDALWWTPRIHLALFVHRVDGLDAGLYVLPREAAALGRLKDAVHREFLWERASDSLPLFRLLRGDGRALAQRLSCDQEIAADGFFSLGMIADFDRSLREHGPSFYRHLFWESGVVGQVLYLEAEAAGTRATGIGCFYDDPVHDVLGLEGHAFQSLYHFTVGVPIEDTRLTTEPGYSWEL
jgi:SagB-type dehydrogenase family enzyme